MPPLGHFQQLARRAASASDKPEGINNIYIVGIVVVAVLLLGVSTWLGILYLKKRRQKKLQAEREAVFVSIRGVATGPGSSPASTASVEKFQSPQLSIQTGSGNSFSRSQPGPSIVMPERTLAPRMGADSREEIINFHRQSGTLPRPFSMMQSPTSPNKLSLTPHLTSSRSPASAAGDRVSWVRHSFISAASSLLNRYSVMSGTSSFGAEPTTGTVRKVKQFFDPVLPDELLLTKHGEQLTVMQSFDDGWCVVGREDKSSFQQKKSLFKATSPETETSSVELGVVPAWCFLKPVKGLRAERPVRSTSLGVTVQMEASPGARGDIISWSNFS